VLLYAVHARSFRASIFADPVGPRAFPLMLAGIMALVLIFLAVRPSGERPEWPSGAVWRKIGMAAASLVAYAYLLEPLGYLLSTTGIMVGLGLLFGAPVGRSALASAVLVIALYFVFSDLLGLYLPPFPAL
jgi:putative tricarboxylic transport membrane protein